MAQVYGSTPVNGVWVIPGTHKVGKVDIKQLVAQSGSERLEGAGMTSEEEVYDEEIIEQRSRVIGYGIDARRQRYPEEDSFQYQPFLESGKDYPWDDRARLAIKDYNLHDLSI